MNCHRIDKYITYFMLVEKSKKWHTNVTFYTSLVMNTLIFEIGVGGEREKEKRVIETDNIYI